MGHRYFFTKKFFDHVSSRRFPTLQSGPIPTATHPISHPFRTEKLSLVVATRLAEAWAKGRKLSVTEVVRGTFARPEADVLRHGEKIFYQENTFGSRYF